MIRALSILIASLIIFGCATQSSSVLDKAEGPTEALGAASAYEYESLPAELTKLLNQAKQAADNNNYAQAAQLLDTAKKQFVTYPQSDLNNALIALRQQDYDLAQSHAEASLNARADYPPSYNLLGVIYRSSGNFQAAKQAYEKAINLNGNYANALLNLGVLADLYLQDYPLALSVFERYLAIKSEDEKVTNWVVELKRRISKGGGV